MKNSTLFTSLDERVSYLIYRTALRIRLRIHRTIRDLGLDISPEQLGLLIRLSEEQGLNQKELAEKTFTDKPSTTRMIEKLEKKQLIKRMVNNEDKRAYQLYLTSKGRKVKDQLDERIANQGRIYRGFTKKEKNELIRLINRAYENLTEE